MIQQSKAYGEDCGGDTSIVFVPHAGSAVALTHDKVRVRENAGVSIHEAMARVLMANASRDDDDDVRTFSQLRETVWEIAGSLAQESGRQVRRTEHTFIHFKRPLPDREDPPTPKSPKRGRKGRPASQG